MEISSDTTIGEVPASTGTGACSARSPVTVDTEWMACHDEREIFLKLFASAPGIPVSNRIGGGTGMGLGIVKQIVDAYNGQIWAESTLGSGTTVWLTFPWIGQETAL